MSTRPTRRAFLSLCGTAALAMLPAVARAQAAPAKLAPKDPTAVALGYVEDASKLKPGQEAAYKAGNICGNCKLYAAAQEKAGFAPCGAVGGKLVAKAGWCRVYVA